MNKNREEGINSQRNNKINWISLILTIVLTVSLLSTVIYYNHLKDEINHLEAVNNSFIFIEKGTTISGKNICMKETIEGEINIFGGYNLWTTSKDAYFKTLSTHDTLKIYKSAP